MRAAIFFSCALVLSSCSTLSAVTDTAKQVDQTKQQVDAERAKGEEEGEKGKGKKKGGSGGSGEDEDGDRLHAKECTINVPLDDRVDPKRGDRFDWRKFQLVGRPGIATFLLHWDEEPANLDVDVYDAYGVSVGKSPPKMEGQQVKKILVQIEEPGLYYVRVSAPSAKDRSIYTLSVRWKGPAIPVAAPVAPPVTPPAGVPPPSVPPPPGAPAPGIPVVVVDDSRVLGSIITAYRDGKSWILYIDRGSADQLRAGLAGQLLQGAEGDKPVDGASFTITQVIDQNKSIARASLAKPPGKNKRVVVNLR